MALADGVNVTSQNGPQKRGRPVIPALPLLPTVRRLQKDDRRGRSNSNESPQAADQQVQVRTQYVDTDPDTVATNQHLNGLKFDGKALNNGPATSTSSVSAHDESISLHSSQDPASIPDIDSSATSAATNDHTDPVFPTSDAQPFQRAKFEADVGQNSDQSTADAQPITQDVKPISGREEQFKDTLPQIVRSLPDLMTPEGEVSPVTNQSAENVAVELSAHTTPTVSNSNEQLVSPPSHSPSTHHAEPRPPGQAFPEATRNGNISSTYGGSTIDGHRSTTSQVPHLPSILEHLLMLATSKQMADFVIQVDQQNPVLPTFVTYAHGLVLLRSERMRTLMTRPHDMAYNLPVIQLTPPRPIQPHAFEAALRFLYSDTILSADALFPRDTYMDKHARAHMVDYALSYWTAGIELGLEPVTARAFSLLSGMVDWDIAELLIREALSLRAMPPPPTRQAPTMLDPYTMGESILQLVLGLFIHRFDANMFRLDTEAHSSTMSSRLIHFEHARTVSNPALAGMVFGSMPASADAPSGPPSEGPVSSAESIASNILLNLDFPDLSKLANEMTRHLGSLGAKIISEVVDERERRRTQVFNNSAFSNKERMTDSTTWDVVGWHETFVHGQLQRSRVGFVMPTKKNKGGTGKH